MNRYYGYFHYDDGSRISDSVFGDFDRSTNAAHEHGYAEPLSNWISAQETWHRTLPWIGGTAIGLGVLIILFPMLLVVAVATLFFAAGASCLAVWWQLRDRSRRVVIGEPWWARARQWLAQRLQAPE